MQFGPSPACPSSSSSPAGDLLLEARSALLLPTNFLSALDEVQLDANSGANIKQCLLRRRIAPPPSSRSSVSCNKPIQLWKWVPFAGYSSSATSEEQKIGEDIWQPTRLVMTEEARSFLFSRTRLILSRNYQRQTSTNCETMTADVLITAVEVLLYSFGTGLVVIHVDWLGSESTCTESREEQEEEEEEDENDNKKKDKEKLNALQIRRISFGEVKEWLLMLTGGDRCSTGQVSAGWALSSNTSSPPIGAKPTKIKFTSPSQRTQNQREGKSEQQCPSYSGSSEEDSINPLEDEEECRQAVRFQKHVRTLGRLAEAVYGGRAVSLIELVKWLVHFPHEDPTNPLMRISGSGDWCYHHTVLVLATPAKKTLTGESTTTVPFYSDGEIVSGINTLGLEANRYLSSSAEGSLCVCWPLNGGDEVQAQREAEDYVDEFMEIYLPIGERCYAERLVYTALGMLSARYVDALDLAHQPGFDDEDKEDVVDGEEQPEQQVGGHHGQTIMGHCRRLRQLATAMVRVTLHSDSCFHSHNPRYASFAEEMRHRLGSSQAKAEIREQIEDLLAIVESVHDEQQKVAWHKEQKEAKQAYKMERQRLALQERNRRRVEIIFVTLSVAGVPMFVLTNLFSMNVPDIPQIDFWIMVGILCAIGGGFLTFMILVWFFCFRNKVKSREKTRRVAQKIVEMPTTVRKSLDFNRTSMSRQSEDLEEGRRPTSIDLLLSQRGAKKK
jgi:hypothetical protein